jgi:hypothetical protein
MKNFTFLFVACFVFFASVAKAQYTVKWCDTANVGLPQDMAIDPGGIIGLNGKVFTNGYYANSGIFGLDTAGNFLWQTNYGTEPIFPREINVTPYHQFVTSGEYENTFGTSTVYANAYNMNGDSVSGAIQQSSGFNHNDEFAHAVMDSQGIMYVGGASTRMGFVSSAITRFDTGCQNRWNDTLTATFASITTGTVIVGDTAIYNLVATNHVYGYFGVSRYDTSGNILWFHDSIAYSNSNFHTCFVADKQGDLIFGAGYFNGFGLTKVDPMGDTVWSRSLSYPGLLANTGVVNTILTDDSSNIYAFGDHNGLTPYYSLIAKYSPSGSLMWMDTIMADYSIHAGKNHEHVNLHDGRITVIQSGGPMSRIYQYDLNGQRAMDTALVLMGSLHSLEVEAMEFFNGDLYIAGINKNGPLYDYTPFVARLGMPAVQTAVANIEKPKALLYPNPVSDLLHFPANAANEVVIMDVAGHICISEKNSSGVLNVGKLVPGIYQLIIGDSKGGTIFKERFFKR